MAKRGINVLGALQDVADRLGDELSELTEALRPDPGEPVGGKPTPVKKKVSLIIHNPRIPSAGNKRLNEVLKWNNADELCKGYIADMREISYGYANYEIVERIEVDGFPVKADGFAYTGDEFVRLWQAKKGFHQPDAVDYAPLLADFKMVEKVNAGKVDEFWLFAFPYAGYYESIMAGPDPFWCNAPAMEGIPAKKRFIIMGFNYQRGVGEMLEAFGHRAESIMRHVFRKKKGNANLWERFARYDQSHPGRAEVGVMHFAPNSTRDYEWGNKTRVKSSCDDWYNFPNLTGQQRVVDCGDWGDGDIRAHHQWWFKHMPHITGSSGGISYNWWQYIIDPNTVR
jgi:hypothetical protein